jgi:hypothetical protein
MNATLGLAVLGYPLVFLGMASLMARVSTPVGYVLIAAGLVSLGLAVSASRHRPHLPWAEGIGLVVLGLAVWGGGLAAWLYGAILFMGMAYLGYGVALFVEAHPVRGWHAPSGWWHFTRH